MHYDDPNVWNQFVSTIDETAKQCHIDSHALDDTCKHKLNEMKETLKRVKTLRKQKQKLEKDMATIDSGIEKIQNSIENAELKCQQIEEYNENKSKRLKENQENIDNVMEIWNIIGLRANKTDDVLELKFTKIDANNLNKQFIVRIRIDANAFKIVETEPHVSLDDSKMECKLRERSGENKLDVRHLIALIRQQLINAIR